jgi:hypothetical protein
MSLGAVLRNGSDPSTNMAVAGGSHRQISVKAGVCGIGNSLEMVSESVKPKKVCHEVQPESQNAIALIPLGTLDVIVPIALGTKSQMNPESKQSSATHNISVCVCVCEREKQTTCACAF